MSETALKTDDKAKVSDQPASSPSTTMINEVLQSGYNTKSSDTTKTSASAHLPSMSLESSSSEATTVAKTAASAASGTVAHSAVGDTYNSKNDHALQRLSSTGDKDLQDYLLASWADVKDGKLSQSAYHKFENTAIPLTDWKKDEAAGLHFPTDKSIEQYSLNKIESKLSAADKAQLASLIEPKVSEPPPNPHKPSPKPGDPTPKPGDPTPKPPGGSGDWPGKDSSGVTVNPGLGGNDIGTGPDALQLKPALGNFQIPTSMDPSGKGFTQQYGVFEFTAKLPTGGWPGLWLMSAKHATNGGPASEIDIMESATAQSPNTYFATLHKNSADHSGDAGSDQQNGNSHVTTFADGTPLPNDLTSAYHTYGVIWPKDSNTITFTLDGKAVSTVPKYDTTDSSPMMLEMGLGKGSLIGGSAGTAGELDVKAVNVYQYSNLLSSTTDPGSSKYGDGKTIQVGSQQLVNTFHQDFTQPASTDSIVSKDGAVYNTPWTDHMWFAGTPADDSNISEVKN